MFFNVFLTSQNNDVTTSQINDVTYLYKKNQEIQKNFLWNMYIHQGFWGYNVF